MAHAAERQQILVVDDEGSIVDAVATALRYEGFEVREATDGRAALAAVQDSPPDLVVLDVMLPDLDGFEVMRRIRHDGIRVPVLFLTARDQLGDLLSGYAAGGDEYLTKPFHVRELVVRLQALVRRGTPRPPARPAELHLDPAGHALSGPGGSQPLTPTEFRLLAALMAASGAVVRRRDLTRAGWPDGGMVADNTLDQYVARRRRKLAGAGDHGRSIGTAVGVGYRLE